MIVFAAVDIAELASNAFAGGALRVKFGELYPEPPLTIIRDATLAPVPKLTMKLTLPVTGVMLVVTSGVWMYKPLPSLVTLTTPIEPLAANVAVAVATAGAFVFVVVVASCFGGLA